MITIRDTETIAFRGGLKAFSDGWIGKPNNLQSIHTPFKLCHDIILKLTEFTSLDNLTFCCFNIEWVEVLVEDFGVPAKNIWFVTDCEAKGKVIKECGRYNGIHTVCKNPLKWKKKMQFDCVIMNPPYQEPVAKSPKKLWNLFLHKGMSICKEGGHLVAITPFSWATPDNETFDLFTRYNTKMIDLNGKKFFPKEGTTISWYLIENATNKGCTMVFCGDEQFSVDLRNVDFLPVNISKLSLSILGKLLSNPVRLGVQYNSFCHSQRTDRVSSLKITPYIYPVKHTANVILYSTTQHPNTAIKKVIFPISSAMKAEYDPIGGFGCSEHYAWVEVESQKQAEAVVSFLHSDVISFLRKSTQWTASWSKPILDKIPAIPLDKTLSQIETYDYFGFDKEERALIQNS